MSQSPLRLQRQRQKNNFVFCYLCGNDYPGRHIPYRGQSNVQRRGAGGIPPPGQRLRPLPRIPRPDRRPGGVCGHAGKDSVSAHRIIQNPRHLLRGGAARGRFHLLGHDGHDSLAPPDAFAGALRTGVPHGIPGLLRQSRRAEPLCCPITCGAKARHWSTWPTG